MSLFDDIKEALKPVAKPIKGRRFHGEDVRDLLRKNFSNQVFKDYLVGKFKTGEKTIRVWRNKFFQEYIREDEKYVMDMTKDVLVSEFGFPAENIDIQFDELDQEWFLLIRVD